MGINLFNAFMGAETTEEKKKKPSVEMPADDTATPRKTSSPAPDSGQNQLSYLFNDRKDYGPSLGEMIGEALGSTAVTVGSTIKQAVKTL